MTDSTRAKSPRKPRQQKADKPAGKKDFPLFGHTGSGCLCKKVRQLTSLSFPWDASPNRLAARDPRGAS